MTVFLDDILVGRRVSAAEMQTTLLADPNSKTARYLREYEASAPPTPPPAKSERLAPRRRQKRKPLNSA